MDAPAEPNFTSLAMEASESLAVAAVTLEPIVLDAELDFASSAAEAGHFGAARVADEGGAEGVVGSPGTLEHAADSGSHDVVETDDRRWIYEGREIGRVQGPFGQRKTLKAMYFRIHHCLHFRPSDGIMQSAVSLAHSLTRLSSLLSQTLRRG